MGRVAIVTDSAADLPPERAHALRISVVPLLVTFGSETFRSGVDLTMEGFYERLLAPGAPFPTTAACAPAAFEEVFRAELEAGAESVVCITVGARLSATHAAAMVARAGLPEGTVRVIDSASASMSTGLLALVAAEAAARGYDADGVVAAVGAARDRSRLYVALGTLEYLRRGGRISGAQAAIGSILSVKPIITIEDGVVETVDRPRTAGRARARLLELLAARPIERAWVLHTRAPGVEAFADELVARTGLAREQVAITLIGSTVAPHVGPGAYGAAVIDAS